MTSNRISIRKALCALLAASAAVVAPGASVVAGVVPLGVRFRGDVLHHLETLGHRQLDHRRARKVADEVVAVRGAGSALGLGLDVTSETSVRAAFEAAVLAYGGVDVIVSNAGIAHSAPVDAMHLADWERSFAVNATGHFLVAREGMRILKAQGLGGAFVFVATKNVMSPGKDFSASSAAKAAEAQLAKVLALEGGAHGIRSNIVQPGVTDTPALRLIPGSARMKAGARLRNPFGRLTTPEDVADVVYLLSLDEAGWINGAPRAEVQKGSVSNVEASYSMSRS